MQSEAATVRVEGSGRVLVQVGTTAHGQSIETTMAQVAADELGIRYEDVAVIQGDAQATPYGAPTGGSHTAVIAGGAVRAASGLVRDKMFAIAAHLMEASSEDLEILEGAISVRGVPARSVSVRDVARLAYRDSHQLPSEIESGLEATARFRPSQFPTWSNATHICVVEIDADTWQPRVLRYMVSEDCGRMINPLVVEGQVFGGVVQGLGGVLFENFVYDGDGTPLTTTLMDYLLPTASEVPDIEVAHLETPSSTNPGGYKGVGEGGAIGAHAAVANAVADALWAMGINVTTTPLGPGEIFALVDQVRASSS
jgi:carbon-monoxide dehydrogenase large subunit